METRAVPASLGSLPHAWPCSVPAPCNQHPSRTFWLRESEARPTGGRKAEGLSSGARSLRKPSLVPAETTSAEGRETEAEWQRCLVGRASLHIHCHLLETPPDQLACLVWILYLEPSLCWSVPASGLHSSWSSAGEASLVLGRG